jgi:hypothetical protein
MRLVASAVVLLALAQAGQARAQPAPSGATTQLDSERLRLANQIMDLAYPPESRRAMLLRAAEAMADQARVAAFAVVGSNMDDGVRRIIERHLDRVRAEHERIIGEGSVAPIFAAFARAYARRFTSEELEQIRAFVATPTGAKYMQQSSDLLSDPEVAQANTEYMARAFAAIQPLQAEMFEELREYLQRRDRPDGPAPSTHSR